MDRVVEALSICSSLLVPLLAVWAIVGIYTVRRGCECAASQLVFFSVLLFIAVLTTRTVTMNDASWLSHTASLSAMIVAGALRRPSTTSSRDSALVLLDQ